MNSTLRDIKQLGRQVIPAGGHLWLFGSRARGDFRPDSDWDLLVVLDKDKLTQTDYDEVTYPFTELGWTLNEQINPIMYTRANMEQLRKLADYNCTTSVTEDEVHELAIPAHGLLNVVKELLAK